MNTDDVINWLYSEVTTLLADTDLASLNTPSDHVALTNQRDGDDDGPYPFVGIRPLNAANTSAGIGNGSLYVDDVQRTDGVVDSIVYRAEPTLRVELVPVTNGDRRLRDNLVDDLTDHFSLLARTNNHPEDIETVTPDESAVQNRSDAFIYGDGLPLDVSFKRYATDNDPDVAESVNLDVDVSETPLDDSDDTDAFDVAF